MTFDLDKIEEEAQGVLLISTMKDGEEIAFCGEVDGEYIGWTPRATADRNGWSYRAQPQPALLALVEVVRAAREFVEAEKIETLVEWRDRLAAGKSRLDAALQAFGDEQGSSSGGETA